MKRIALFVATAMSAALVAVVTSASPASACLTQSSFSVYANTPWHSFVDDRVHDTGSFYTSADFCGDYAQTRGQRKECGVFGCNYSDKASSGWNSKGSGSVDIQVNQGCAAGTNRYQTVAEYLFYPAFDAGNPEINTSLNNVEISC